MKREHTEISVHAQRLGQDQRIVPKNQKTSTYLLKERHDELVRGARGGCENENGRNHAEWTKGHFRLPKQSEALVQKILVVVQGHAL